MDIFEDDYARDTFEDEYGRNIFEDEYTRDIFEDEYARDIFEDTGEFKQIDEEIEKHNDTYKDMSFKETSR